MSKAEGVETKQNNGSALTILNTEEFELVQDARRSIATTLEVVADEIPDKLWRGADFLALEDKLPLDYPESAEKARAMLQNLARRVDSLSTPLSGFMLLALADALDRLCDEEHQALTDMLYKLLTQADA